LWAISRKARSRIRYTIVAHRSLFRYLEPASISQENATLLTSRALSSRELSH